MAICSEGVRKKPWQIAYQRNPKMGGGSINGGYPHSWIVCKGKSHLEMDDDWRYPYFRKPPYCCEPSHSQQAEISVATIHSYLDWFEGQISETPHISLEQNGTNLVSPCFFVFLSPCSYGFPMVFLYAFVDLPSNCNSEIAPVLNSSLECA